MLLPLLALLAVTGCRDQPSAPALPPLAVHFTGCAELAGAPLVCALGAGPLRLWVPGDEAPVLRVEGEPVAAQVLGIDGGFRVELTRSVARAETLVVETGAGRFWLPLAPPPPGIDLGAADAEAQIEAGLKTAAGAGRARLLRAAGRVLMRRGELDRAADRFAEAEGAARAAGIDSEGRLAGVSRAICRVTQGRIADARAVLAGLPPLLAGDAYGAYATRYGHAVVARAAGDLRGAVRDLDAAAATAERVGLAVEAQAARNEQGGALLDLGRVAEADAVYTRLREGLGADADPCVRGDASNNLAWARIRAGRGAEALIDEALALYAGCGQLQAHRQAIARVNLAVARLDADDPEGADAALRALGAESAGLGGVEAAAWRSIVEGRLLRRRGEAAAAAEVFTQLEARAEAAGSAALAWRARLERGLTAEGGCDWATAIEHYRRAEALLFDESLRVAAGDGRTGFLADRGESAALLVRALVASGQVEAAFDAARRARRRGLLGFSQQARLEGLSSERRAAWEAAYARYAAERAALDAEVAGDWDRSTQALAALGTARAAKQAGLAALLDEMATLAGGSLRADAPLRALTVPTLGWFVAPATASACGAGPVAQAFVFAAIEGRVEVAPLATLGEGGEGGEAADPAALAALFGPFASALDAAVTAGAARVELLPAGRLGDRDLHLAPIGGLPLALRVPVAWRLDGPAVAARGASSRQALVVIDPRVDLAEARREGDAVIDRLRGGGWTVARLQGTAATRDALRAGFAGAELFHYAGHAVAEGLDGWQSAFLLAEGPMTVGDLLTLPAVPRWAVLAGCETGQAPGEVSGIGLAHALLATGAEAVIATVRPVADRDAAAFSGAFYDAFGSAPPVAYRAALAAVPAGARGAFRLLVP